MIRPCNVSTCPNLAVDGTSRCAEHTTKDNRPSSHARGYGGRWRKTRAAYLAAHPFCEVHDGDRVRATDVDHIDGKGPNGPMGHVWANLRAMCHECHSKRTARDQPGGWNRRRA